MFSQARRSRARKSSFSNFAVLTNPITRRNGPESMNRPSRPITRCSNAWAALLLVVLAWLGWVLSREIQDPWVRIIDYNGAVWSQAAHNILRAGLITTWGQSSAYYFGPLPIPPSGYYLHHPPGLHLVLAALFALFGEHEWVARMLPISCSLGSVILLWLLVRSCVGIRAATLSAAVFACLPMVLRYGKMVNFEPPVLMLILGALLCLRYWQLSTNPVWRTAAFGFLVLGMWVDWAMYIFVVILCIWWFPNSNTHNRRFAVTLLFTALISGFLYLISIRLLRPDALQDLSNAFLFRIGSGNTAPEGIVPGHFNFSEVQWIKSVVTSLMTHFLAISWVLAAIGCVIILRDKRRDEGLRWLGSACLVVFMMDAIFLGVFQNESYIHKYVAYYLVAPISITAGVALDRLITQLDAFPVPRLFRGLPIYITFLLLVAAGICGQLRAGALENQSRILDCKAVEPANLIPELGKAIRESFSSDTYVLCNFADGPQLSFYAQRILIKNLVEYRSWTKYLQGSPKRVGGVVWMGSIMAEDIVTELPAGTKRFVKLGDVSFCFWRSGY
jgi:dolichyl-phosphate-mannose-protein mannosyltransferase